MKVGDIVFEISRYSGEPVMFTGPVLVTQVHSEDHINICYLNNPHTDEPQGLGYVPGFRFEQMEEVPEIWEEMLPMWVKRAIASCDPNLTMTAEARDKALLELERLLLKTVLKKIRLIASTPFA